jgi:transposase
MILADPFPEDIETLHAFVHGAVAERDAALAERDSLAEQNDRLLHLLRQVQRMQFGRRSKRLDPDQLQLALEDIEQATCGTAEAEKRDPQSRAPSTRRRGETRASLPPHLPRIEVVIPPEETVCPADASRPMYSTCGRAGPATRALSFAA